jgi:outer membrane protein OmpA-like peptidoglycan-associated protein
MKHLILGAVALALIPTACETGPSNRVLLGGAGGAIVGAGLGTLAGGDDKRNAAIGAAVGAIAGASAGAYMDKQERELRAATAGTGIEVARNGDQIALTMPSNVTFAVNSAEIMPGFYQSLDDVSNTLVNYPSTAVDIIGHASSDGDDAYNQALSERRANSVKGYLINHGVVPVRLQAYGMGETQPIADNSTEAGRRANRRVEIILTPITES